MKQFKFIALIVAITLGWAGFASSSFAYHIAQPEMASMSAEHHMSMEMAAMPDCPSHKAGQMKMDASKCAVACYGLVSPVAFEPVQYGLGQVAFHELVKEHGRQLMVGLVAGVPTPPPNFA